MKSWHTISYFSRHKNKNICYIFDRRLGEVTFIVDIVQQPRRPNRACVQPQHAREEKQIEEWYVEAAYDEELLCLILSRAGFKAEGPPLHVWNFVRGGEVLVFHHKQPSWATPPTPVEAVPVPPSGSYLPAEGEWIVQENVWLSVGENSVLVRRTPAGGSVSVYPTQLEAHDDELVDTLVFYDCDAVAAREEEAEEGEDAE